MFFCELQVDRSKINRTHYAKKNAFSNEEIKLQIFDLLFNIFLYYSVGM